MFANFQSISASSQDGDLLGRRFHEELITCQLHVGVKADLLGQTRWKKYKRITPLQSPTVQMYRWVCVRHVPTTFVWKTLPQLIYLFSPERIRIMFVCVFLSSLSISPSWECRIKILALPIQTLPSSSKQKSIRALLCKNLQRNLVPRVALLSVSILVYLDLRIYTPLMELKNAFGLKF